MNELDPDAWIFEDDRDEFPQVTCANGCPEGAQGRHKFSCFWSGRWFYGGQDAKILGESHDEMTVCLEVNGGHFHADRYELLNAGKPSELLSRIRYPHVTVHLSTGHDGNIFSILGTATGALRKAGHKTAAERLAHDLMATGSYDEALRLVQQTVHVT
jgi:hypothetical protein